MTPNDFPQYDDASRALAALTETVKTLQAQLADALKRLEALEREGK